MLLLLFLTSQVAAQVGKPDTVRFPFLAPHVAGSPRTIPRCSHPCSPLNAPQSIPQKPSLKGSKDKAAPLSDSIHRALSYETTAAV